MANSSSGDSVVDRVVRLLTAIPASDGAVPVTDLAERAQLPLSTAQRLVRQLASHGLLEAIPGGTVRPGIRLWELANRTAPTLALRQAAMPFMDDIHAVLNQNVNLAVLDGWEALFVERLSRRGSVPNRAQVAGRMPVHISSAGLALMAFQPKDLQAHYLDHLAAMSGSVDQVRTPVESGHPHLADIPASADHVRLLLAEAAQQGFAQLAGVVDPETWGIAVPVLDRKRRAVASLGVVVPLQEMRLQALMPALQTAARGIARSLGYAPGNH